MADLLTGEQVRAMGYNPDTVSSIGGKFDINQFTGGGSSAPGDTVQRAIQLQQEASKPAVQSLQASIPEVQKSISTRQEQLKAESDPLKQRYDSLLAEIKGNQQVSENRQTVVTSNELGKRGILGSSTLAGQEITNAVNPITQQYTGLYKTTALDQEKALKDLQDSITNLGLTGTDQQRAITNAIAQLQAGASSAGITQGLQQEQFNKTLSSNEVLNSAEAKRAKEAAALQKLIYETVTLPQSKASVANTYSTIKNRSDAANDSDWG